MGKRLFRYSPKAAWLAADLLRGKDVSVVLKRGSTYFGKLLNFEGDNLHLQTAFGKHVLLREAEIHELVCDQSAAN